MRRFNNAKNKSRQWDAVCNCLFNWNPMGFPVPSDEYDFLAPLLTHGFDTQQSVETIAIELRGKLVKDLEINISLEDAIDFIEKTKNIYLNLR